RWGETLSSPLIDSSPPRQLIQHAPKLPLLNSCHQTSSNWILAHILNLGTVVLVSPYPMMKSTRLKSWCRFAGPPELPFPIGDPLFDREVVRLWCAEQMNVVWHDHVMSDQPVVGGGPGFDQPLVYILIRQSRLPLRCTNRQKSNRRIVGVSINPLRGIASSAVVTHGLDRVSPHRLWIGRL